MGPYENLLGAIASLAAPYAVVLAVPGPNAFVVLRASLMQSPWVSFAAAFGIASGGAVAAALAAFGMAALPHNEVLHAFGALVVALYLGSAALKLQQPAQTIQSPGASLSGKIAATTGFLSAAMNPFSLPFFAATFLSRPEFADPRVALSACVTVFAMALIWWASLGLILCRVAGLGRLNLSPAWRRVLAAGLLLCALTALWQGFAQFTMVQVGR